MTGLFDQEGVVGPLFDAPSSSVPQPRQSLFPAETLATDTADQPSRRVSAAPLFADGSGAALPPPLPKASPQWAPATLPPEPLAPLPLQSSVEQPTVAFDEDTDPLAARAIALLMQHCPRMTPAQMVHRKSLLKDLFPLSLERLQRVGRSASENGPLVIREVSAATQKFAQLSPALVMDKIARDARLASGISAPQKGFAGLLAKVESHVHAFDPDVAQGQLMALFSAVKSQHGRLLPLEGMAQAVMDSITDDLPVLDVLEQIAGGSGQMVTRRKELLLTMGQQVSMAIQQLHNLQKETEGAFQSIDEFRTITLPGMGFLAAIR